MKFHYCGHPNGVRLSAAVCQASPRSPPQQINQIVRLAVKLSGASIHRSVFVCALSVRTNAHAKVRETLFYRSSYVKHSLCRYSSTDILLFCATRCPGWRGDVPRCHIMVPDVRLHIHTWPVQCTRGTHAHKRFPQTRFKQPLRAIFNTLARVCEG